MTPPDILCALVSTVAGITWVAVFRPSLDEVSLVGLWGLCLVLSVL